MMGRNTCMSTCGRYGIAWGKDHAVGWFIQVFDTQIPSNDPAYVILDKDAMFDGLTVHELLEVADAYNAGDMVRRKIYGEFL